MMKRQQSSSPLPRQRAPGLLGLLEGCKIPRSQAQREGGEEKSLAVQLRKDLRALLQGSPSAGIQLEHVSPTSASAFSLSSRARRVKCGTEEERFRSPALLLPRTDSMRCILRGTRAGRSQSSLQSTWVPACHSSGDLERHLLSAVAGSLRRELIRERTRDLSDLRGRQLTPSRARLPSPTWSSLTSQGLGSLVWCPTCACRSKNE